MGTGDYPITSVTVGAAITKATPTILANNNSVTVTHNLGYVVKILGLYGTNDEVNVLKIINEGVNSFDIAFAQGITPYADCTLGVTYV